MDHSELLSLPEDDLLAVLSYLSAEELLHCRQVCRRLRDVCLHPSLWRSVRLLFKMKAVALRALRLAPCLRNIVLHPADLDALQAVYTSSCAIEGLSMNVAEPSDVPRAMGILQRVSSVGALRELDMNIHFDFTTSLEMIEPLLYLILCSLNDLKKLAFWSAPPTGFSRLVAIKPSLTSLTYTSCNDNESYTFLATLLKGHAATLTSVELDVVQDIPVSLLKDIPNLKSLACPPMDALSDLHSARFLETLDLAWPVDEFPPGALEFLGRAPQLRHVSISFPQENSAAPLLSLSESPSAVCVETLSLRGHWPDGCLEQVAAALHHFPSLRTLDVATVATSSLIRAVDPASTPRLTELKSLTPARVCVHNWLHGPVQDLLTRNPNLHLRVASIDGVVNAKECTCVWCDWGFHPELKRSISFAFSSHRRTRSCPADCFRLVI